MLRSSVNKGYEEKENTTHKQWETRLETKKKQSELEKVK